MSKFQAEQKYRNPSLDNVIEELIKNEVIKSESQVNRETGAIETDLGYTIEGKLNDYLKIEEMEDTNPPEVNVEIAYADPVYEKPVPAQPTGGKIYTESDTGEKVPLPKNFVVKEGTVNSGLVVTGPDESEFVWIPVPYVVATGEDVAEEKIKGSATITIDATDESGIEKITNITEDNIEKISNNKYKVTENGEYVFEITDSNENSIECKANVENIKEIINKAIAINLGNEVNPKYRGLVYEFTAGSNGKTSTSKVMSRCTTTLDTYREPANLTGYPNGRRTISSRLALYIK